MPLWTLWTLLRPVQTRHFRRSCPRVWTTVGSDRFPCGVAEGTTFPPHPTPMVTYFSNKRSRRVSLPDPTPRPFGTPPLSKRSEYFTPDTGGVADPVFYQSRLRLFRTLVASRCVCNRDHS